MSHYVLKKTEYCKSYVWTAQDFAEFARRKAKGKAGTTTINTNNLVYYAIRG